MIVPEPFAFVVLALALARVVKLLTDDAILDVPRDGLTEWALVHDRDHLAYFVTCPWCVGIWVALAGWLAWLAAPVGVTFAATPLALAMAASFAASRA